MPRKRYASEQIIVLDYSKRGHVIPGLKYHRQIRWSIPLNSLDGMIFAASTMRFVDGLKATCPSPFSRKVRQES